MMWKFRMRRSLRGLLRNAVLRVFKMLGLRLGYELNTR
jgi:hypothetical protein